MDDVLVGDKLVAAWEKELAVVTARRKTLELFIEAAMAFQEEQHQTTRGHDTAKSIPVPVHVTQILEGVRGGMLPAEVIKKVNARTGKDQDDYVRQTLSRMKKRKELVKVGRKYKLKADTGQSAL